VGCEARKIPAWAEVFFLDFYLYRDLSGTEKYFHWFAINSFNVGCPMNTVHLEATAAAKHYMPRYILELL
jgi:hypothetical protein